MKTNDEESFAATKRLMSVETTSRPFGQRWNRQSTGADAGPSRTEGVFVGGSSGSALSGALRYLKSSAGQHIACDPNANVVVILPDGVRNYMSKPWFLEMPTDDTLSESLRGTIRGLLGRELNDPAKVVQEAEERGEVLQQGQGLEKEMGSVTLEDQHQGPISSPVPIILGGAVASSGLSGTALMT